MSELPHGWATARLGAVLPIVYGKGLPTKNRHDDGAVPVIGSSGVVGYHDEPLTSGPCLVIGRKGNVGSVHYSQVPCWPIDTVYFVEQTEWLALPFFKYQLLFVDLRRLDKSTAIPGLSRDDYSSQEVAVPSLPEQHRIVEAIESYFTRLDDAVATLERVQRNLKRYRASVLQAAVEGRLVTTEAELARAEGRDYQPASVLLERILAERRRRWEEAELAKMKAKGKTPRDDRWKAKYQEPAGPDARELPELPDGWAWTTVDALQWDGGYGTSQKCHADANGPPVLRIPNVQNESLTFHDLKFATAADGLPPDGVLLPGDFLFIRTNGSKSLVGRGALVTHALPRAYYFASYLIRIRLATNMTTARWFALAWHVPIVRDQLLRDAASSAGQHNVSLSAVRSYFVPIPPLGEQERILEEVERLLSINASAENLALSSGLRVGTLRQSILKWAFEGRLVDQDPTDEPAARLLERIKAEGEGEGGKPGSRGKRVRRQRGRQEPAA